MSFDAYISRSDAAAVQGGSKPNPDYQGKDGSNKTPATYKGYDGAGRKEAGDAPDKNFMIPDEKRFSLNSPAQIKVAVRALQDKQFRQKYDHRSLAAMESKVCAACRDFGLKEPMFP